MPDLVFAYPGDLNTPTGGYGYDRQILAGLRPLGWQVTLLPLGDGFPFPSQETINKASDKLATLPDGTLVVADGLAFGALGEVAARIADHLTLVALVHHPLCQENGLDTAQKHVLLEGERVALQHARHVIVTSPATSVQVQKLFGVDGSRVTTVLPGTEKPLPYPRPEGDVVKLLSVGTVVPRKGYDLLFSALAPLKDRKEARWHLDIVGGLTSDPACHADLKRQATDLGLADRITFHGAVPGDDLEAFYRAANVFVLASRYEGYGMAYTEALSHGLPVIGSGGGAVRDTLPDGASIYCGTEDVAALGEALERLIFDASERGRLEQAARIAARDLPDWSDMAGLFARTLSEIGS
ncbi:glycosyltransferase family 4 protein [Labrenzia sp. VG12]|uniref:glycosyltransferase family 4 protein n=1 Tax=Labrenzia sp. VG12 TaxID=2021862 RepID=UPI000B8C1037|nr:glycosyltransferase family 4 protein [Labrenzia sp. VG12]ASP35821.1 glycosyl transferase family 1 [Labrenzia sp. VG12]